MLVEQPVSVQLRYLQTVTEIGVEKNSTVVFPVPGTSFRALPKPIVEIGFGMVFGKIEKLDKIAFLKDRCGFGVKFSHRW